jgi:hypothetical protein
MEVILIALLKEDGDDDLQRVERVPLSGAGILASGYGHIDNHTPWPYH